MYEIKTSKARCMLHEQNKEEHNLHLTPTDSHMAYRKHKGSHLDSSRP